MPHVGYIVPLDQGPTWERSLILAPIVLTVIGFVLFEGHLETTTGRVLARTGAPAYLLAGIVAVTAETLSLRLGYEKLHALLVVSVVGAFLA